MIHVVARTLAVVALLLWFFILALEFRLYQLERQRAAPKAVDDHEKDRPGLSSSLLTASARSASRKSA